MDNASLQDSLIKVYQILKFVPEEIKKALADLAGLQQLAVAAELIKSLTKEEIDQLNKQNPSASDAEKQELVKTLIEKRKNDAGFKAKTAAAAKKVLDDHIAYLKTRGDEAQKEEIAAILAEIA